MKLHILIMKMINSSINLFHIFLGMYDKVPFHPDQSINSKRTSYTQSESSALFADLSSNNDSSYADTSIHEVPFVTK